MLEKIMGVKEETTKRSIKNSLNLKSFILTAGVLFFSTTIIYLLLYLFIPTFYENYKKNFLDTESENTISSIEKNKNTYAEGFTVLRQFSRDNNVSIIIFYETTPVYIASSTLPSASIVSSIESDMEIMKTIEESKDFFYSYESRITFNDSSYSIIFSTPLQPVSEVRQVMGSFLPYIITILLITSIFVSFIYSRMITMPLLELNRVAKQMAKLDFHVKSNIQRKDELGELGESLNSLSANLEKSMEDLRTANLALKGDIEKERLREEQRISFIATMSHELKSPITAIRGQLEGMLNNIGVYQNRDKYLQRSLNIVQDLDGLVKEIIITSKLDNVEFQMKADKINLSIRLEEIIKGLDYLQMERKMKVVKEIEKNLTITGDWSLLKKAFGNIIENAFRYGTDSGSVRISARMEGKKVVVRVFNKGESILESDLKKEKIFEAFYRTEKSRNRETGGSGLGLYIVKKILVLHKYKYKMENKDGGVLFTVEIPNLPKKYL